MPRGGDVQLDLVLVCEFPGRHLDLVSELPESSPRAAGGLLDNRQGLCRDSRHDQIPSLDDRGLLPSYLGDGVSELRLVVEADRGHHCDPSVPDIGGVQPTPESDLAEGDLGVAVAGSQEAHSGEQLMVGGQPRRGVHPPGAAQHLGDEVAEPGLCDELPADADPLPVTGEVGLGEERHIVAGVSGDLRRHGTDRALAIGTRHQRAAQGVLGVVEGG